MHRGIVATVVATAALGALSAPALAVEEGPSVSLTKTVYAGHDGGSSCAGSLNYLEANQTDPVTYCFTVTNSGTTFLASVIVTDALVPNPPQLISADSTPLAPGASARYYVDAVPPADEADGIVDDTFLNTASASALPVDAGGIPVPDTSTVVATAEAIVYPPEVIPTPAVVLATSVYAGHDGGAGCPAADVTTVRSGDPVTYCFTVDNSGTTYLDEISFSELMAGVTPVFLGGGALPLAPGATQRYFLDATAPELPADGYHANPTVSATAVDDTGAALAGLTTASSTDGALIEAPAAPVVPARPVTPVAPPVVTAPAAQTTAPQQLAYTGWETLLLALVGVALLAGGWTLITSGPRRGPRAAVAIDANGRTRIVSERPSMTRTPMMTTADALRGARGSSTLEAVESMRARRATNDGPLS